MNLNSFYITAQRTSGERVYYVAPSLQDPSMIPNALSLAARFSNRTQTHMIMLDQRATWRGLTNWEVCKDHSPFR